MQGKNIFEFQYLLRPEGRPMLDDIKLLLNAKLFTLKNLFTQFCQFS